MKTYSHRPAAHIVLCAAVLTITACAEKGAVTRSETLAARESALQADAQPAEAKEILMRMAELLGKTPRFSVDLKSGYDVVQVSGQKIEFGESRRVIVSRPNGLRVEAEHSDGKQHLVVYDGEKITAFSPLHNVYAQVDKPGGIDEAIMYFLRDLNMRLPLAMLLVSRLPAELERRTESLDYVERTEIHGTPSHHLAGRTETVDYQVWIEEGARPLPIRAVLTYKNAEGQPQFRATFSNWNLSPELHDSQFAFIPPEGARKISFLAQLPRIAVQGTATPLQTGGEK
ncbi:DUF2092 domain-containing protein [Methylohalobius crimeensis]|uniref:DUF2092 domain-containing protein n=1 Tax=Methylohalobius crimeensis TaxID=244365 RepID=UPI00190FBD26|nr:DUF2092 domain-containing protein [Methylohalobius crimeensis]